MAIIYTYPTKATPLGADLVLISDSADGNKSKNATIASLVTSNAINVVDTLNSLKGDISITGGTNINVVTSGQNITVSTSASNVDGSGTANKIPKWSDSNTLTDSIISESGDKIGIGTIAPLEKLDVRGILRVSPDQISATQTGIILKDNGTGTNEGLNIDFQSASDTNTAFIGSVSLDNLRIGTAGAERIRILGDGNVGIGTTTPSSKLTILDSVDRDMSSTAAGQFQIGGSGYQFAIAMGSTETALYTNSSSRSLTLGTNETPRLTVLGTGNVGIGTTAPVEKLDVTGNIKTSGSLSLSKASNSVKISTPATITTSYELVMPAAVGTASQVLKLPSPIGATPHQLAWGDATGSAALNNILVGDGAGNALKESVDVETAIQLPVGATARRPTANASNVGLIRYNTSLAKFEGVQETGVGTGSYAWFQLNSSS